MLFGPEDVLGGLTKRAVVISLVIRKKAGSRGFIWNAARDALAVKDQA
jgi:hypothetical protein